MLTILASLVALGLFFRLLLRMLQGPTWPREDFNRESMSPQWLIERKKQGWKE